MNKISKLLSFSLAVSALAQAGMSKEEATKAIEQVRDNYYYQPETTLYDFRHIQRAIMVWQDSAKVSYRTKQRSRTTRKPKSRKRR